jgi:hypothetical protein
LLPNELPDLEECITHLQYQIQLTDDTHAKKGFYYYNLGVAHRTRYDRMGELTDLGRARSMFRKAVEFTLDGNPLKATYVSHLGFIHGC